MFTNNYKTSLPKLVVIYTEGKDSVTIPVATVILFSLIVNDCPEVMTILLRSVKYTFACSPGSTIEVDSSIKIIKRHFINVKHNHIEFVRCYLPKSILHATLHVLLNNC